MTHPSIRNCVLLVFTLFVLHAASAAQDSLVKFYPFGPAVYCKGCGHAGTSYWKVTLRLENISGSDLILYGQKLGNDFGALSGIQRRNPNVCDWEYGYGESVRRVPWSKMSDWERTPRILKAGEILDSDAGFGPFEGKAAIRFAAFVAQSKGVVPTEIFSVPYLPSYGSTSEEATYRIVDDVCSPQCKIGIAESPKISGVQLGMSLIDFQVLYPKVKIHTLYKRPDTYKTAYIWAWTSDAYSVNVTFINDKVGRIEPKFRSLDKARDRDGFWERISSTIGMPYFWEPYQSEWKCPDFVVVVTPNKNPTITIQTPEFIKVRDRLNEEALKRK
jgi:hypothetical protein